MKLPHVLSRSRDVEIDLNRYRADELKKAARFWIGKEATKFAKEENIQALTKVFQRKSLALKIVPEVSDKQKHVLGIFARYGPVVSGPLLSVEVEQRGLVAKKDGSPRSYYAQRRDDAVNDLCDKLILLSGGHDHSCYFGTYGQCYPELTLHPALVGALKPAEPLPWQSSEPSPEVKPSFVRSSAEPALDLWRVAEALRNMGNWVTVKGDALSKGSRNKLTRLVPLPAAETDALAPPDPESLFYELLREMKFLSVALEPRQVLTATLEHHFDQPPVVQAWYWLHAWLNISLWQDGIGIVPDRDNHYDPVRIEPNSLRSAKELLIWVLCRVAHSALDWLDLEVFLKDFWTATHEAKANFYWGNFTWHPNFVLAQGKDKIPAGPERLVAFWLDREGTWAANAIMVTLATLGLIERGESDDKKKRPSFRLTPLGRQVFRAPELDVADQPAAKPFLTVQPNHDILAYFDEADARRVCTLARFAHCGSATGRHVQTFSLTRASVYSALEAGMTLGDIETFLAKNSKTEVPANVLRMLHDWSSKRESLVLHSGVTVALVPQGTNLGELGSPSRVLSDTCAVLPKLSAKKAATDYPDWFVLDHLAEPPRVWQIDELGEVQTTGSDLVSRYRLMYLADRSGNGWLISEKSVRRARQQGFTTDQILAWLADHHPTHKTPSLLEMAIRNWTGRASAFTGKVYLLQIPGGEARDAILNSTAFQPLLAGHIPPDWFLVHNDKVGAVEKLLKRLGFQLSGSYRVMSLDKSRKP